MIIEVETFKLGDERESRDKILEEAQELVEAFDLVDECEKDCWREEFWNLMFEIGDVLTATLNLCDKMGIDAQRCVDMTQVKNILRGYYDTIDS